jgi:hypothetical protein
METGQVEMKRRWHWSLWAGLFLALAGVFSAPLLINYSITRDFAWANFALLFVGAALLFVSLLKSFRQSEVYKGKVLGTVFFSLTALVITIFAFGIFVAARVPKGAGTLAVGSKAPEFTLTDQDGRSVTLGDLLGAGASGRGGKGALLIFYRGHW